MTREQAVASTAAPLADAYRTLLGLDGSTVEAAARAAWTPTGPDLSELIERITHRRAQQLAA